VRNGKEQGLTFDLNREEAESFIRFMADLMCDIPAAQAVVV
jgi:hypothetical protein